MAKGMPVVPRLELLRWAGVSTSSMLRMGSAAGPGLCVRAAGLSARRPPGLWLPSRRATTSLISSSIAASSDDMVAVFAVLGWMKAVNGTRSRAQYDVKLVYVRGRMAGRRGRVGGVACVFGGSIGAVLFHHRPSWVLSGQGAIDDNRTVLGTALEICGVSA
jgi:hypothetical protein